MSDNESQGTKLVYKTREVRVQLGKSLGDRQKKVFEGQIHDEQTDVY